MKRKNEEKPAAKAEKKKPTVQSEIYDWVQSLITALMICVVLFLFFVRVIDVSGGSMNPTLFDGNKMLVSDLFYKPKAGDVVIFKKDEYDPDKALVKRVIATGGQTVNIDFDTGIVYVDGEPLEEDYTADLTWNKLDFMGPWKVPEGSVFVMGDNRNASTDSRDKRIGNVDERLIIGKAYVVVYPISELRYIR